MRPALWNTKLICCLIVRSATVSSSMLTVSHNNPQIPQGIIRELCTSKQRRSPMYIQSDSNESGRKAGDAIQGFCQDIS
ncbi:hypothetical protein F4777DRAFT_529360 [Nemania sp. FL0916]|nr:hypothetical protein F4777DRAFT_529360 [Nemania sp. FL0916]